MEACCRDRARTISRSQPNSEFRFGQPPLTVYCGRRFYIEALTWMNATMAIHQHGFAGAFCVLQGSSIHCTYAFREHSRTTERLLVGDLVNLEAEHLRQGDVRRIASGRGFIHALYHLEQPSVSVVVRTTEDLSAGIPYSYFPPYIAIDPFDRDLWTIRALQYLDVVRKTDASSLPSFALAICERGDDLACFHVLHQLHQMQASSSFRELAPQVSIAAVLEVMTSRFGRLVEPMRISAEEAIRREEFATARRRTGDAELRYFLALLMNVPRRADILRLMEQRFGGDPVQKACQHIRALSMGEKPIISREIGDDALTVLEGMMRNLTVDGVAALLRGEEATRDASDVTAVRETMETLREQSFFRPLIADIDNAPASRLLSV